MTDLPTIARRSFQMSEIHTEAIDIDTDSVFCMNLFDKDETESDVDEVPQEEQADEDTAEPRDKAAFQPVAPTSPSDLPPFLLDQEILFRELITQHQRRLYRFVIKYIDHPDDAADITQQAFVEAARTIASFRGDSKLSTWLFGIAMNMVRNYQIARYTVTASVFSAIIKEVSDSLKGTANKIG
jgi:hypothetical protein